MSDKQKGVLALLVAATLTGFLGVLSRYINFHIPLFYQTWVRDLFQLVIVLVLYIAIDKKRSIAPRDIKWFALRSACGFANVTALYIAFTRITIGTTYFLSFAAATICGYMLGSLLFKERVNSRGLVALGLSIAGLALVYTVSFHASTVWYSVAAIVSGIVAPGWSVFSKQISKTYSNIQMNLVDTAFAVAFCSVAFLITGEHATAITLSSVWLATYLLSSLLLIASFLVVYGFRRVDAQTGTLLLLFEIVAGTFLGYVFFRQTVPFRDVAGGAMILLAIYLRTYSGSVPYRK